MHRTIISRNINKLGHDWRVASLQMGIYGNSNAQVAVKSLTGGIEGQIPRFLCDRTD